MNTSKTLCPVCDKDDKVEKVTAIVPRDTYEEVVPRTEEYTDREERWRSYTTYETITRMSILAQRLSPPPKPGPKGFSCVLVALGIFMAGYLGVFIGLGGLFLAVPMLLLMGGEIFFPLGILSAPCFLGTAIVGLGLGFLIFHAKSKHDKKERERVAHEEPLWREAMKRWERLYYCQRDDIVFDPEMRDTCQPQAIREFVYLRA